LRKEKKKKNANKKSIEDEKISKMIVNIEKKKYSYDDNLK
jgi:hypothetical protein